MVKNRRFFVLITGYIYCISNAINNKLYVGKTLSSLKERLREHITDAKKPHRENRPLYRAMNKYGSDNFTISLLEEVPMEQLADREMYWIEKLDTYKNGYNATLGGDGKILYGEDMTIAFVNDFNNGMTIKEMTKKYNCDKAVIVQRLRKLGIDTTLNHTKNNIVKINQYDCDGNFIQSFQSISDAARYLIENGLADAVHCARNGISGAARGQNKTSRGFVWRYAS